MSSGIFTRVGVGVGERMIVSCVERQQVRKEEVAFVFAAQKAIAFVQGPGQKKNGADEYRVTWV